MLSGLIILTSYVLSPAMVTIPGIDWEEPALVWLCINMPTGSGKSSLYKYLVDLANNIRRKCGCSQEDPAWFVGDATFEKMGEQMSHNGGRLFGLYDELSTFFAPDQPVSRKGALGVA